jgi:hypothetical protein
MNESTEGAHEAGYFGGCPICRRFDNCLNVGLAHWYCCHAHRTRWCVGRNLFSSWRHEDESTWKQNAALLAAHEEVKSYNDPQWIGETRSDRQAADDVAGTKSLEEFFNALDSKD